MKTFFLVLACSFMSLVGSASGQSLEDTLAAQKTVEISPVSFLGNQIAGSARSLCAMLGYTRVVTYKEEKCQPGTRIKHIIGPTAYSFEDLTCDGVGGVEDVLVSLTCAK